MTNKLTPGASTGRATKLPTIPVVRTGNAEMDRFVLAVKEYIEVRDGVRGNPYDRFATVRDVNASIETARDVGNTDGLLLSDKTQTTSSTGVSTSADTAKLRTELARTERNLRDTIAQLAATVNQNALTAQAVQSLSGVNRYTQANLSDDLASGAATIIAGATSGNAVMELAPDGSYVLFKHRLASIGNLGAGYTGTVRTAVGITAAGFLAGFNRRADGVFQPSVVIDSATGDVTILGTLKANSVIEVGAFLGSQTVSSVLSDIADVTGAVEGKLDAQAEYILGTDFSLKTATFDAGTGLAITNSGLIAKSGGVNTVTITNTGDASFKGTVAAGSILADSITLNSAGGTSLAIIAGKASGALPSASFGTTLQTSLDAGVATVIAGTGSNYRLKVDSANSFVAFQHKDAVYKGTATTGSGIRPAVGISAAGIAMGYNDAAGVWQNAVSLSSTGDLTVKGTITAGSIITGSVTIGAGGTTLTTVQNNASGALALATTADSNATTALADAADAFAIATSASDAADAASALAATKLNKNAADILTGPIEFQNAGGFKTGLISIDSSGNATGTGVAITSKGIVGRNSGGTTFTIDATTGAATFKGDITGASGTFSGRIETLDYIKATGTAFVVGTQTLATNGSTYTVAGSVYGTTGATGTSGQVRTGVYGNMGGATGSNSFNIGVIGIANQSFGNGFGVYGQGYVGGYFATTSAGAALVGQNTGAGPSLNCTGSFAWGSYTYTQPDGGTDKYLRNDGQWAPVANLGGGTVTSVGFSTGSTGLTVTGSPVTTSGTIALGGTLALANGGTGATTASAARTNLGLGNVATVNAPGTTTTYLRGDNVFATFPTTGTVTSVGFSTGTTGLTVVGSPITTSGTLTLSGTLALANGGTGATTASAARTNLGLGNIATVNAPGTTTTYLRGDNVFAELPAFGTVTSVGFSTGTTGLTVIGSPITTSGTLTLSGTLALANGGTGATTASAARTNLGLGNIVTVNAPGTTTTFLRGDNVFASLSASNLTASAPGTSFYLSGGGWASTSPIITSMTANSGSAVGSGSVVNLLGSTSTGIAGAYVGTSASGSTVTFQVQATSPSDVRLKEEITDADLGLDFVNSLRPVSYKLKSDPKHQKGYGFIADEVEALIGLDSSLVYHEPDWKVGDVQGFKTIHYPSYIAVLTKAMQELSARVAQLEQTNVS